MHWYLSNLIYGFRLATFLPKKEHIKLTANWHALIWIVLSVFFLQAIIDTYFIGLSPTAKLQDYWIEYHAALFALIVICAYFTATTANQISKTINIAVSFYFAYIFILIPYLTLHAIYPIWITDDFFSALHRIMMIWAFLISFRIAAENFNNIINAPIVAGMLFALCLYIVNEKVTVYSFYYDYGDSNEEEDDPLKDITSETLFTSQNKLLEATFENFTTSKPKITDIYGITLGSYGYQDVFMRESSFVADTLKNKLNLTTNVISLVNNKKTATTIPLANATNLKTSLNRIQSMMQKEEDILILFLSSHGAENGTLSVNLKYNFTMNQLSGKILAQALADSGIQNRVIIISACHSGALIPHLKNDNTMIITAAADKKQSYGCSDDADLTYFTNAYFNQALSETTDLEKAYELAREKVTQREKNENLPTTSDPQIYIGKNIKEILKNYKPVKLVIEETEQIENAE